jgi:D-xylose transport system permease protein
MSETGAVGRLGGKRDTKPAEPRQRGLSAWTAVLDRRIIAMVLVFAVLAIVFHIQSDGVFFTSRNLSLLLRQAAGVAVLAAGVSMLMVMAEIDLSIGSAVFLTGVVAAKLQVDAGMPTLVAVLAALAAGCVLGAWQGFWVVRLAVPSFIVTLAGLLAFRGAGLLWTEAATVAPFSPSYVSLSESFIAPGVSYVVLLALLVVAAGLMMRRTRLDRAEGIPVRFEAVVVRLVAAGVFFLFLAWIAGGFLGVPTAIVWVAALGLALWVLMTKTTFGRNAYLIGSNREAARLSGINVPRQIFIGFVIMGFIYGVAGVLLTARLGSSTPGLGQNLELDAIAAAVIGGTSLAGGIGTIPGALAGALLLATIRNGMSLLDFSSFAQLVVMGFVLLLALTVDTYAVRHRRRPARAA